MLKQPTAMGDVWAGGIHSEAPARRPKGPMKLLVWGLWAAVVLVSLLPERTRKDLVERFPSLSL